MTAIKRTTLIHRCVLTAATFGLIGSMVGTAAAETVSNEDGYRQVNHIAWDKTGDSYQAIVEGNIPKNKTKIVFVRPADEDPLESSVNIGIDGHFQVSLQPGQFSEVMSCAGEHDINIIPTGDATNQLAAGQLINLAPQEIHYFFIEVENPTNTIQLYKIDQESALEILGSKLEQTHQISRVTADNCPDVVVVEPEPVVIEIDEPVTLDVLFEFDSAKVLPVYSQDIAAVADFMREHPDTTTQVDGHTDSIGAASYNLALSERRANAVKGQLVNRYGTEASRINVTGYGESQPIADNSTREGRQLNRRVIATVTKLNGEPTTAPTSATDDSSIIE